MIPTSETWKGHTARQYLATALARGGKVWLPLSGRGHTGREVHAGGLSFLGIFAEGGFHPIAALTLDPSDLAFLESLEGH